MRNRGALAILLAASLPAGAQQSSAPDSSRAHLLGAVVVTASRRAQRVSDSPVTTELISRTDIDRSGAQDLNSLITRYVGVQPEPGVVGSGGVQIEGMSSQHVLVLIDGQPMVGRIDGELDVSRVPLAMVDRVEVIKGPLSTLYGSSAMGGVINVITRGAFQDNPAVSASLTSGTQGRLDAHSALRGGVGDFRGIIGGGRREDNVQPGRSDQSGARANRWDANGAVHWVRDGSRVSLDASVIGTREDQRWKTGQLWYFSNNTQQDARVSASMVADESGAGRAILTAYYSRFDHLSRQATIPEPASSVGDVSGESLGRVEATYGGPLWSGVLDAGFDLDRDVLSASRIPGGQRSSITAEPFAQYSFDVGRISLVPGARLSVSSEWGAHVTPKIAALVHLGSGFAARLSTAAGYRAPDFKELYISFLNSAVGYVVHGNPLLRPEASRNFSGGVEWSRGDSHARVQAYANEFSNFIESVQSADSGGIQQFTYGNVARGFTRGVEVEGGFKAGQLILDASVGLLEARDRVTGLPLLGTTPRSAAITARTETLLGFRPSVSAHFWSAAPSALVMTDGVATFRARGAFASVDGQLSREVAAGLTANVGVTNMLGTTAVDWPGDTMRRLYVGLSVDRGF